MLNTKGGRVSIPYSSGLSFSPGQITHDEFLREWYQSPIHRVLVFLSVIESNNGSGVNVSIPYSSGLSFSL